LSLITHPNIISYFGSHVVGESAFLFMELCNQGTLTDWLRRNGPVRDLGLLAVWIAHVANGLWFIHRNGVVHRDVKPSNIMIRDNVLKLADFSSAKLHGLCCQKVHDTQMAGSPSYMAPEVITGGQSKSSVVGAQDIWSFGCVIYEMVTGKQPFEEVDNVWSLYFLL
ncbi:kinase-like domain-containing protein, partial [Catenaria anguillulae PL171]